MPACPRAAHGQCKRKQRRRVRPGEATRRRGMVSDAAGAVAGAVAVAAHIQGEAAGVGSRAVVDAVADGATATAGAAAAVVAVVVAVVVAAGAVAAAAAAYPEDGHSRHGKQTLREYVRKPVRTMATSSRWSSSWRMCHATTCCPRGRRHARCSWLLSCCGGAPAGAACLRLSLLRRPLPLSASIEACMALQRKTLTLFRRLAHSLTRQSVMRVPGAIHLVFRSLRWLSGA